MLAFIYWDVKWMIPLRCYCRLDIHTVPGHHRRARGKTGLCFQCKWWMCLYNPCFLVSSFTSLVLLSSLKSGLLQEGLHLAIHTTSQFLSWFVLSIWCLRALPCWFSSISMTCHLVLCFPSPRVFHTSFETHCFFSFHLWPCYCFQPISSTCACSLCSYGWLSSPLVILQC